MKSGAAILFFTGIAAFTVIIAYFGAGEIANALAQAGAGLLLVTASHFLPLFLDSIAWRPLLAVFGPVPSLARLMQARWIGESINSLLPAAQIGGDFARARFLVKFGVAGAAGGGSVVVELTIAVLTQVIFTLMGIGCLLHLGRGDLAGSALAGAVMLGLLCTGFVMAQRLGMWRHIVKILSMIGGEEKFRTLAQQAEALDSAVMKIYTQTGALVKSTFWRLAGWVAGVAEVWIAMRVLGAPVSLSQAFMLESLGQAVRAAAFLVPGALGIQEGGFILLGSLIGMSPELSVSLSLAKRVRELLLGIPGLVYWQVDEGSPVLGRIKKIMRK